jgi:hypothetical protein
MREKVLLAGEPNTSKTLSLVSLATIYPDRKVVIFDPDDGTAKVVDELGIDAPNLEIVPVGADWEALMNKYAEIKAKLTPDDWLCFDMLGRFWDLAQQYYSSYVFGKSPLEHLMNLRKQAEKVSFGGFDGLQDWTLIKRLHNEQLIDDAVIQSKFNVMATTSVTSYLPVEKVPQTGIQSIYAKEFGIKLEGEKHNFYRFDTQAVMYRTKDGKYMFRLMRDRGRSIDIKKEFDITGKNFWEVYQEYRNPQ